MRIGHAMGLALIMAASAPLSAAGEQKADSKKMVCRDDAHTGSRVRRSVCLPQEEWDAFDKQSAQAAKDVIKGATNSLAVTPAQQSAMTMGAGGQ